jgi:hypothetical protein
MNIKTIQYCIASLVMRWFVVYMHGIGGAKHQTVKYHVPSRCLHQHTATGPEVISLGSSQASIDYGTTKGGAKGVKGTAQR